MSHQQIIQTLIEWIDDHIDQPLNIDVVAKKSGYSKWYLQRPHHKRGQHKRQMDNDVPHQFVIRHVLRVHKYA